MELKAGTVNAIVGPSGSGKSTIAKLSASLWDVDSGSIKIGGVDVKELAFADFNRKIAYVAQDNYLFNETVRENIRQGNPDATDEQIIEVTKKSENFPLGSWPLMRYNNRQKQTKSEEQPMVYKHFFGRTPEGQAVTRFTLFNHNTMEVNLLNYGAAVHSICVPDKEGMVEDITLGCDTIADYIEAPHFGGTIGRVANRIAGAKFTLNGKEYQLAANDGGNHLHGGKRGFDRCLWQWSTEDIDNVQGASLFHAPLAFLPTHRREANRPPIRGETYGKAQSIVRSAPSPAVPAAVSRSPSSRAWPWPKRRRNRSARGCPCAGCPPWCLPTICGPCRCRRSSARSP